jgi:hypothetical protein
VSDEEDGRYEYRASFSQHRPPPPPPRLEMTCLAKIEIDVTVAPECKDLKCFLYRPANCVNRKRYFQPPPTYSIIGALVVLYLAAHSDSKASLVLFLIFCCLPTVPRTVPLAVQFL